MESLQLPKDLFWTGKLEPFSPDHQLFSLNSSEEEWTIENCLKLEKSQSQEDLNTPIILDEEITKQLLKEFDLALKSDDDSLASSVASAEQWTDSYGIQNVDINPMIQQHNDNACSPTFYYQEQQNGFPVYQQQPNELTQLTPPQSPPMVQIKDDYIIQDLISQQQQQTEFQQFDFSQFAQNTLPVLSPVTSEYIEYASDVSSASPVPISEDDVARETEIVDEILRKCAQDLPDTWNNEEDDSSSSVPSYADDDDSYAPSSPSYDGNSSIGSPVASSSYVGKIKSSTDKKRTRPYGRGPEERKSRKKEQNKNAATRYRLKKKEEMKLVLDEEGILAEKHEQLAKEVAEYESEVKYLKKLIREFYKNK